MCPRVSCCPRAAQRACPAPPGPPPAHAKIFVASRSLTDARAGQIESNYDETTDSFDAMNLKAELLRGVYAYGFERPSAIQQRAIMPVIKGECPRRPRSRAHRDGD
jgi:hypothetical protein